MPSSGPKRKLVRLRSAFGRVQIEHVVIHIKTNSWRNPLQICLSDGKPCMTSTVPFKQARRK